MFSEYELENLSKERLINTIIAAQLLYKHRNSMGPIQALVAESKYWNILGTALDELTEGDLNG